MIKQGQKRFIVRKYIMAKSASEALRKERKYRPDDVYVDDAWLNAHGKDLSSAIGFTTDSPRDYEY